MAAAEKGKKWTTRRIIQAVFLYLLLFGFPIASWYYLDSGLNYRKDAMAELNDLGPIPGFEITTQSGDQLTSEVLKKKIVIAGIVPMDNSSTQQAFGDFFKKLHAQFNERDDVAFVGHMLTENNADREQFINQYELNDPEQCHFLLTNTTVGKKLYSQYHFPEGMDAKQSSFVALVDTSSTIRKYYNVLEMKERKRLVEHIAFILPRPADADIIYEVEQEK